MTKKQEIERINHILNSSDECLDCGFKAVFLYTDTHGNPLCPKCDIEEIEDYKSQQQLKECA